MKTTFQSNRPTRPAGRAVTPTKSISTALGLLLVAAGAGAGAAEGPVKSAPLADLSSEQLLNESVTSVAKKETKLSQSPAAISVITQEDIRRSGLTSLPELLRTVPGLDVARINASQWAISSRTTT